MHDVGLYVFSPMFELSGSGFTSDLIIDNSIIVIQKLVNNVTMYTQSALQKICINLLQISHQSIVTLDFFFFFQCLTPI